MGVSFFYTYNIENDVTYCFFNDHNKQMHFVYNSSVSSWQIWWRDYLATAIYIKFMKSF